MKMITNNECECERCTLGREGHYVNNMWSCHITGRVYELVDWDYIRMQVELEIDCEGIY